MNRPTTTSATAATLLLAGAAALPAQAPPTLTPADYDRWEMASGQALDPAGRWAVQTVRTVGGEVELRLHAIDGDTTLILPRGSAPTFTDDGRWMLYIVGGDDEAQEDSPEATDRLGAVDLSSAQATVRHRASSFQASPDGRWVASLGVAPSDSVGADLTVLDLSDGNSTTLGNVDAMAWRDSGALLALAFRTAAGEGNGVALFEAESGRLQSLDAGNTRYRALTWRDDAGDLAVLRELTRDDHETPGHEVLLWTGLEGELAPQSPAPRLLDSERAPLGDSLRVIDAAGVRWSDDGRTVFVGLRDWPRSDADPEAPVDSASDADTADGDDDDATEDEDEIAPSEVQIWHWDDDRIQRAQESRASFDGRLSYLAAWHLDDDRLVRLGREYDEAVRPTPAGRWGVVDDNDPWEFERRFGASTRDVYRVDISTGERTPIAEGVSSALSTGPVGERALIFDDGWVAIDLASLERTPLGTDGEAEFLQSLADYDYPGSRPPWGIGGWADDESVAWLYDKYDVWEADLATGAIRRLTDGAETGIQYRLVDLDPDSPGLDPEGDLHLRFVDLDTRASGYARTDGQAVEVLVAGEADIGGLRRAADADVHLLTRQRFDLSPELLVAGAEFDDLRTLATTNDFQDDYAWGHNELLRYTTDAGHDLHAILTYPADYDASRSYPLILYQYERLSQGMHRYVPPSQTGYYNVQVWSQQGYFVLQPDILYEPGRPGPSAIDAIEHALDAALAAAPVDEERMGLIGHSWGGYQAAYVPTRMHRFAASVAGAAITNFLSFPGTVHWNGGLPELGHWETGQARMALPPWADLEGHLESSPVAAIHELETPVLLMHGDADGVVDFRQGLEYYNYARRLGKPVVMLMYPGADHGLRREENQVDYQTRILEWFDHWLKGAPAASWITEGEDWETRARRIGG